MLLLVFLKALQWGKVVEKMYILCIYIWLYVYDLCGKKKRDSIGCLQRTGRTGTKGKGSVTVHPLYLSHFVPYECFIYSKSNT